MKVSSLERIRLAHYHMPDPRLAVPFRVRRIPSARVLWRNERWFAGEGFEMNDARARRELDAWLVDRFGVLAEPDGPDELWADLYGTTNGSIHGGSGRAGSVDGFNAKGIGRTPLAARNTDFHHSHGSLWLYEAVREIVAAEVVATELPHGAVPIVALLDTDHDVDVPGSTELARRAIIVRPDFLRPATFERSIYFGEAGTPDSEQVRDARRVAAAVGDAAIGIRRFEPVGLSLAGMFRNIGEQLGAGRAARLWQGQFSSANISVDGAWTDFGAFCSMPDWRRTERDLGERFGDEERLIAETIRSVHFSWGKYAQLTDWQGLAADCVSRLPEDVSRTFRQTLRSELSLDMLVGEAGSREVLDVLGAYYAHQQKQRSRYEHGDFGAREWIGRSLRLMDHCCDDMHHYTAFRSSYLNHGSSTAFKLATARRVFEPRQLLYQAAADRTFKCLSNPTNYHFNYTPAFIERYIRNAVARSRRFFPAVVDAVILCQLVDGPTTLVLLVDHDGSAPPYWQLTAPLGMGGVQLGEATVSLEALGDPTAIGPGLFRTWQLPIGDVIAFQGGVWLKGLPCRTSSDVIDWRAESQRH